MSSHDSTIRRFLSVPDDDEETGKRDNPIGRRKADREIRWVLGVLDDRQVELQQRVDELTKQLDKHALWLKLLLLAVLGVDGAKFLL